MIKEKCDDEEWKDCRVEKWGVRVVIIFNNYMN